MFGKNKLAMLVAELVGTTVLSLVFVDVHATIGYPIFVALGAGIAVGALTLIFGPTSGAQFNPALTLGLWTNRKVKTIPAILYIAMQVLGGAVAFWLYGYLVKSYPQALTDKHYIARIMLAEAMGAFVFAVGWAAAAAHRYVGLKLAATVGGAFALGIIVASFASNGFINPAIALSANSWAWSTYVLGPVVGGIVGVNLYNYLFVGKGWSLSMSKAASATVTTQHVVASTKPKAKAKAATKAKSTKKK